MLGDLDRLGEIQAGVFVEVLHVVGRGIIHCRVCGLRAILVVCHLPFVIHWSLAPRLATARLLTSVPSSPSNIREFRGPESSTSPPSLSSQISTPQSKCC